MSTNARWSATFYRWTRDLHLYFGLFVCPFLLIFAVTTILLNHRVGAGMEVEKKTATVNLDGIPQEEQADEVLSQLSLSGETFARHMPEQNRLQLVVARPADNHLIRVDLKTGAVEIERRIRDLKGVLIYLHFNPGPHKVKGVTWIFSKLWGWSVDAAICLVLFLTLSGVYLWGSSGFVVGWRPVLVGSRDGRSRAVPADPWDRRALARSASGARARRGRDPRSPRA